MPFGVSSGIQNVIIHAKFQVDRLRGFWAAGPPKVPFPILIGTTLTTVLHYRADCEKSKCMYCPSHRHRTLKQDQRPIFQVGGHPVKYINEWSHLGHIVSADGDDKPDIINRRNILCGQINVLCYLGKSVCN